MERLRQVVNSEIPPTPNDFKCYYLENPTHPFAQAVRHDAVRPARQVVQSEFGITLNDTRWGTVPRFEGRIPYFLVNLGNPLEQTTDTNEYLGAMSELPYSRVNVIATFPPDQKGSVPGVREYDATHGVNTIYGDYDGERYRGLSVNAVVNNIISETLRVRARYRQDTSSEALNLLDHARRQQSNTVEGLRSVYSDYELWHRSPQTDGAFGLPAGGAYLVSQTRTDKTRIGADQCSLITGYDARGNVIDYVGDRLPTSDLDIIPVIDADREKIVVHFHRNDVTRGDSFEANRLPSEVEHGSLKTGLVIANHLKSEKTAWAIQPGHGVTWRGRSPTAFGEFVSNTLDLPRSNKFYNS